MVRVRHVSPSDVDEWDGKHPLGSSWSLWYFNPYTRSSGFNWGDCLKKIGSFDTIEDFWSYFNHIQPPSFMRPGCDLCFFKEGIRPAWEDQANKGGGRWDIPLNKGSFSAATLDDYWLKLVMDLVGGRFDEQDSFINGVMVNRREKCDRVSLWTSISHDQGKLSCLGRIIKDFAGLPIGHKIFFRTHGNCSSSTSAQKITITL